MKSLFASALRFRKKWGNESGMTDVPYPLSFESPGNVDLANTYIGFIREELKEIEDALVDPNMTPEQRQQEVGDGLCDALVFLIVMIIRLGYMYILPMMYDRVETSNLSKGHDGKLFDESGKMIKGPDFVRVDFQCMWSRSLLIAPTLYEAIIADHPDGLEGMTFRLTNSSWLRVSSASPHPPPYHTLIHHYPEHQALYPI